MLADGVYCDRLLARHFLGEYLSREFVEHAALYGSFHGSCSKLGIETFLCKDIYGCIGDVEFESLWLEHPLHGVHLQAHHVGYLVFSQWQEHDRLVDSVEEFRTYGLLEHVEDLVLKRDDKAFVERVAECLGFSSYLVVYHLTAEVRGHDDDRVLEVHRAAFVVG